MKLTKGAIAVIVGAVLVFLGLILPFYSADIMGFKMKVSLLIPDGISIIALIWLIFAVASVVSVVVLKNKLITLVLGVIAGIGTFISFIANNSDISELSGFVSKGAGYYFAIIGAIVMVAAAIFNFITTKDAE